MLGWGTAMVYPTFLATVAENTHPRDWAKSLGVFRLWRDLGYAVGALLTGIIADTLGSDFSMIMIGALTLGSAVVIARRMRCRTNAVKLGKWFIKKFANYKEMAGDIWAGREKRFVTLPRRATVIGNLLVRPCH